KPVREFEIQLVRIRREASTEDPPVAKSFKSATGHFIWPDVAAGTWRAAVSAPGYQVFNVNEFQLPNDDPVREIVMPLQRGFALHGRVFDSSTGAAIADARIGFRPANNTEGVRKSTAQARSKSDGSFTLDGLPRGDIVLMARAQDHEYRELRIAVDEKTPPL